MARRDDHREVKGNSTSILITGANSGLGFATCCRLIDEFLYLRSPIDHLILIFTTRDEKKGSDTQKRLEQYLKKNGRRDGPDGARVSIQAEQVDLTSLRSVLTLSERLLASLPKLDVLIWNAGKNTKTRLDWPKAIWQQMTDPVYASTYPTFLIPESGYLAKPQLGRGENGKNKPEPRLGDVFCANVFGHYLLTHRITPLLASAEHRGRIIGVSSTAAYPWSLDINDIQSIDTTYAYESSKRLTDALFLTAELPSTKPWVDKFFSSPPPLPPSHTTENASSNTPPSHHPHMYLSHPGVCATSIVPVTNPLMLLFVYLSLYLVRLLGSPWHTISPYKGSCAAVWLALASQEYLDAMKEERGKGKWGSAVDWRGRERVIRTEVEGWGFGGVVGDVEYWGRRARKRGVVDLTEEERRNFELVGRDCWKSMEELRVEWEELLSERES